MRTFVVAAFLFLSTTATALAGATSGAASGQASADLSGALGASAADGSALVGVSAAIPLAVAGAATASVGTAMSAAGEKLAEASVDRLGGSGRRALPIAEETIYRGPAPDAALRARTEAR